MVPTLLLFGLVAGRWWKSALLLGCVGWVAIGLQQGFVDTVGSAAAAGAVALGNTAVGVAVHQALLFCWRYLVARRGEEADVH
ncbi:MAG: hypothetical protein DCC50_04265 [Acidobacteria bacterium]|nr:MAG: hypothetical protein DCC50_04265 [Acidobacteriota bacterium]